MSENDVEEHSSPIKTPKQLIIVVVLSFLVPIVLIVLLSQLVTTGLKTGDKNMSDEAVALRLRPVGQVEVTDPNAPKVEKSGKEVVEAICGACHLSGALGAPKVGDKAGWGGRIGQASPRLPSTRSRASARCRRAAAIRICPISRSAVPSFTWRTSRARVLRNR